MNCHGMRREAPRSQACPGPGGMAWLAWPGLAWHFAWAARMDHPCMHASGVGSGPGTGTCVCSCACACKNCSCA